MEKDQALFYLIDRRSAWKIDPYITRIESSSEQMENGKKRWLNRYAVFTETKELKARQL